MIAIKSEFSKGNLVSIEVVCGGVINESSV